LTNKVPNAKVESEVRKKSRNNGNVKVNEYEKNILPRAIDTLEDLQSNENQNHTPPQALSDEEESDLSSDNDSTSSSVENIFSKIVPSPRKEDTLENTLTQKSYQQMPCQSIVGKNIESSGENNTRLLDNEDSNQGSCSSSSIASNKKTKRKGELSKEDPPRQHNTRSKKTDGRAAGVSLTTPLCKSTGIFFNSSGSPGLLPIGTEEVEEEPPRPSPLFLNTAELISKLANGFQTEETIRDMASSGPQDRDSDEGEPSTPPPKVPLQYTYSSPNTYSPLSIEDEGDEEETIAHVPQSGPPRLPVAQCQIEFPLRRFCV